jgi:type II secretory pathway component PulM
MEDHRLGDLLRELPREQARPGFTARVLERLDSTERTPRPRRTFRPLFAGATAAVLLAVATGVVMDRRTESIQAAEAQRMLQEIRAEHGRLEQEIQELSQPPVVYIGGNEDVDLVLDLGKASRSEGATPAAYHGETF